MTIRMVYRRMPAYIAVPLALLASAVVAATLAVVGAVAVDFLLDEFRGRRADLEDSFLGFFFAAPAIAILAFVFCFSILVNWHHAASWQAPTFAFALGAVMVWAWSYSYGGIGFPWYAPGIVAWIATCWRLHRKVGAHSKHVIEA